MQYYFQVKSLKVGRVKDGRFRIFGGLVGREEETAEKYPDPSDLRLQLLEAQAALQDQREANLQLKDYMGEVLGAIMASNPGVLERQ